jgi:hypothetical protein
MNVHARRALQRAGLYFAGIPALQVPPGRLPLPENYAGRRRNLYALGLHPRQLAKRNAFLARERGGFMGRALGAQ